MTAATHFNPAAAAAWHAATRAAAVTAAAGGATSFTIDGPLQWPDVFPGPVLAPPPIGPDTVAAIRRARSAATIAAVGRARTRSAVRHAQARTRR